MDSIPIVACPFSFPERVFCLLSSTAATISAISPSLGTPSPSLDSIIG